ESAASTWNRAGPDPPVVQSQFQIPSISSQWATANSPTVTDVSPIEASASHITSTSQRVASVSRLLVAQVWGLSSTIGADLQRFNAVRHADVSCSVSSTSSQIPFS